MTDTAKNPALSRLADGLIKFFDEEGIDMVMFSLTLDTGGGFLESDVRSRFDAETTKRLLHSTADQYTIDKEEDHGTTSN